MSCWYNNSAPDGDVAVSTRIRLARNINGYPFPARMNENQRREVNEKVKAAITGNPQSAGLKFIEMKDVPEGERSAHFSCAVCCILKSGEVIANIVDSYTAEIYEEIRAPHDGLIFFARHAQIISSHTILFRLIPQ